MQGNISDIGDYVVLSNRPINKSIWSEFLKAIRMKYGTTYGHVTEELEKAIMYHTYMLKKEVNEINEKNKTK